MTLFLSTPVIGEKGIKMKSPETFDIAELIAAHLQGHLSKGENCRLEAWLKSSPRHQKLFNRIVQENFIQEKQKLEKEINSKQAVQQIFSRRRKTLRTRRIRMLQTIAAFLIIISGITLWLNSSDKQSARPEICQNDHPHPGFRHATLVLPDGNTLALGTIITDSIVERNGAKVIVTPDHIKYTKLSTDTLVTYHTLTVPKGGEYMITLEDGTSIHLNADSRLRYPSHFTKNKREVFLSGEAYFQVAHHAEKPFLVQTPHQTIQVYGTEFNVNTRSEEMEKTVLVEGSIGIRTRSQEQELKLTPSQIAEYDTQTKQISVREVDTRPYTAWQEGLFLFDNAPLKYVLDELARWYDIKIFYTREALKELRVSCYMQRFEDISLILDAIEQVVKARFELNNKTLTVNTK